MKNVKYLIWGIFLLGGLLVCDSASAAVGTGRTLSEKLENYQQTLIQELDDSYTDLYANYVQHQDDARDYYDALSCLGIVTGTSPKQTLQTQREQVRTAILEQYISYKADLDRYNLNLSVDMDLVTSGINHFVDIYRPKIHAFTSSVSSSVQTVDSNVQAYYDANKELLQKMSTRMQVLAQMQEQYSGLNTLIQQFNNSYASGQFNIFQTINDQKKALNDALSPKLQAIIDKEQKISSQFVTYIPLLQARQSTVIRSLQLQIDQHIASLIGNGYDANTYAAIQDKMTKMQNAVYDSGTLNCQKLLTTSLDIETYAAALQVDIAKLRAALQTAVNTMQPLSSGDVAQIKSSLLQTFQTLFTSGVVSEVQNFTSFKDTLFAQLASKNTVQRSTLQQLQTEYTRYAGLPSGEAKNILQSKLVPTAKELYNNAVMLDVQAQAKQILEGLGQTVGGPTNVTAIPEPTIQSDNVFVPLLAQLATRLHKTNEQFAVVLTAAMPTIQAKIDKAGDMQKAVLQKILQAVELYVQTYN